LPEPFRRRNATRIGKILQLHNNAIQSVGECQDGEVYRSPSSCPLVAVTSRVRARRCATAHWPENSREEQAGSQLALVGVTAGSGLTSTLPLSTKSAYRPDEQAEKFRFLRIHGVCLVRDRPTIFARSDYSAPSIPAGPGGMGAYRRGRRRQAFDRWVPLALPVFVGGKALAEPVAHGNRAERYAAAG
jgi:hypothetical protein